MQQRKSKKLIFYFFLLILLGSINNLRLDEVSLKEIKNINIYGLDDVDKRILITNIQNLNLSNIFFINKNELTKIVDNNTLVENYSIFKKYPSTIDIKIKKTNFLAQIIDKGDNFFLGSNGKLIKTTHIRNDIPFIFGNFDNDSFFDLKTVIDDSNLSYHEIKSFFFFKSGRWDIELNSGLLIKLPKSDLKKTIKFLNNFLESKYNVKIDKIDLRQKNQMIINGK